MGVQRDLVFVSYYCAASRSVEATVCSNILTQLKPYQKSRPGFKIWHRSQIPAGMNRVDAINAALERCRVAVLLVSSDYLVSEHWENEAKPLLEARKRGEIHLLWQQIDTCNCEDNEIFAYQQMIQGSVLRFERSAKRNELEQRISKIVFDFWNTPYTQSLSSLALHQQEATTAAASPHLPSARAFALVLAPAGGSCYQWQAYVQAAGENRYEAISHAAIDAPQSVSKETMAKLIQGVKQWIGAHTKDICVLDIFVPDDLLDKDWGSISLEDAKDPKPLHSFHPYLLRSSDRLLDPSMSERKGALRRMHQHLVAGSGTWLPQDQLTQAQIVETLDGGLDSEAAGDVVAAICCYESSAISNRSTWLRSVLKSMAPLVVWPSPKDRLPNELAKEEVASFLRELALDRDDRPHCSDLDRLARTRQAKAKLDWPHPKIDLGLTILVAHPERRPDGIALQALRALLPSSSQAPSSPLESERPEPSTQLLISP